MYQTEFAERMVAKAGTKDCGRLSIMVQTYAAVQTCFRLPPQCFSPRPQVHSTVVKIFPPDPIFYIGDRSLYADVVRALFSHRRKTVRNGLRGAIGSMLGEAWVGRVIAALPEEILRTGLKAVPRGFCYDYKYSLILLLLTRMFQDPRLQVIAFL